MNRTTSRLLLIIVAVLVAVVFFSGKPSQVKKPCQETKMKSFDKIVSVTSCDVVFEQGADYSVRVDAEEEQLKAIAIYVKHGCLRFAPKYDNFILRGIQRLIHGGKDINLDGMTLHVISPKICKISMGGAGSFIALNGINAKNLDIHLIGSGNIVIDNLKVEDVKTHSVGSGNVCLKGEATHHQEYLVGGGTVDVSRLK